MNKKSFFITLLILSIAFTSCDLLEELNDVNLDSSDVSVLNNNSETNTQYSDLSVEQQNDLVFMFQEEKVARDVYLTMAQKYNARIFSNIAISEQRHMDAVKSKIDQYNIPIVGYSDDIGKFIDPHFENLYQSLVAAGNVSLEEAINVGVQIEILDIKDLEERIEHAEGDIVIVFENLLEASKKHLSAFNRWASNFN